MIRTLKNYALAVGKHWWYLVGGFVLALMDLGERVLGTWWLPPAWAKWTTAILGLCIAQFLAYRDVVKDAADSALRMRAEIDRLAVRPYSDEHRSILERKIGSLDPVSRALVVFLLHNGQTRLDTLGQRCQIADHFFREALARAERENVIKRSEQLRVGRAGTDLYFEIKPEYRIAIEDLLGRANAEPYFVM